MLSRIVKSGLALLLLLCVLVPMGCGSGDTHPDAMPAYEVVGDNLCTSSQISRIYLLDNDKIAVVCGDQNSSIYLLDEDRHTSTMIYDRTPSTFLVRAVVGDIMYMTPQGPPQQPELQALRLDAGATTPSAVVQTSLHGIGPLAISGTHAYWAWADQQGPGLSRVTLAGGAEENITLLPFVPQHLAILGEDVYALGYPSLGGDDYNISIVHISSINRTPEIIFSEPKGTSLASWFGVYRDHVLWSDDSAVPPKTYEIRGGAVQQVGPMRCAPWPDAVLTGDLLASKDFAGCFSGDHIAVTATDLSTGRISYYWNIHHDNYAAGARSGWIYEFGANTVSRVQTLPLP